MKLSAIFLTDVGGVNVYQEAEQIQMTEGDTLTVYLQLRDMSVQTAFSGFKNPGRRYMPAPGAQLSVQIDTLNNAWVPVLTKVAAQPFAQDPSIWMFQIVPSDSVKGTKRLKLALTEGAVKTYGIINSAILVSSPA